MALSRLRIVILITTVFNNYLYDNKLRAYLTKEQRLEIDAQLFYLIIPPNVSKRLSFFSVV